MYPCVAMLFEVTFFAHTLFLSLFFWGEGDCFPSSPWQNQHFLVTWSWKKRFRATFEHDGIIPMSIVNPGCYYIGLRECPIAAFIRAKRLYVQGTMSRESHILLKIHFSPAAVLHYISKSAGRGHAQCIDGDFRVV